MPFMQHCAFQIVLKCLKLDCGYLGLQGIMAGLLLQDAGTYTLAKSLTDQDHVSLDVGIAVSRL